MNSRQNMRWQHLVLIAATAGLVAGAMILVIAVTGMGTSRAAPWQVGAMVMAGALIVGALAARSLRRSTSRARRREFLDRGAFELPEDAPEALVKLNARIAEHFTLDVPEDRGPMPSTFGELVSATAKLAGAAAVLPAHHDAARAALGSALGRSADSIRWSAALNELIPAGRARYPAWQRLRAAVPRLPDATLNPWVENIAFYTFFAALIAIAVPIAQRLDSNPATRIDNPTVEDRVIGKALALVLFAVIIAILMIPVYVIGRRYACRLPECVGGIGELACFVPSSDACCEPWAVAIVSEHLRDLVSRELGMPAERVNHEMPLARC